jgi:hypothetical protein
MNFSWEINLYGAARTWFVGGIFLVTGIFCLWLLPYLLAPSAIPNAKSTTATVIRMDEDEGMRRPVFAYKDAEGVDREFASGVWSGKPSYRMDETATIKFDPTNPTVAFLEKDKDMEIVNLILRIIGTIFGLIGATVLAMKLRGMDDESISRIGGLIGALTYAIPATLVLPGLLYLHSHRPNLIFDVDSPFGTTEWALGAVFTLTGILTLIGSVALYRYQKRTGKSGWYWSRST